MEARVEGEKSSIEPLNNRAIRLDRRRSGEGSKKKKGGRTKAGQGDQETERREE